LLARAVRERPPAGAFEGWLLERTLAGDAAASGGALRAMALEILADWRQARASGAFRRWLRAGAPSDDREPRPA
jgi:hypothetical protein